MKTSFFSFLFITAICFVIALIIQIPLAISVHAQGVDIASLIDAGKELMGQHKYEQALQYFNKAVAADPKNVEAHFWRGVAFYWMGKYTEANSALDTAMKINDKHYLLWYYKGKIAVAQEQQKESLTYFEKSIELNPQFKDAWFDKGLVLYGMEEYRSCIGSMGRVISLDNTDGRAYCVIGMCYFWLGEIQQARDYISKGLSLNPAYKEKIPEKIKKGVGL